MQTTITDKKRLAELARMGLVPEGATRATVTVPKSQAGRPCSCGCGQTTSGGLWSPGHDAKRKSALYGVLRSPDATKAAKDAAIKELRDRRWPQPSTLGSSVAPAAPAPVTEPKTAEVAKG